MIGTFAAEGRRIVESGHAQEALDSADLVRHYR